jgi:hypothetical protein
VGSRRGTRRGSLPPAAAAAAAAAQLASSLGPGPMLASGSADGTVFVWEDRLGNGLVVEAQAHLLRHPLQKGGQLAEQGKCNEMGAGPLSNMLWNALTMLLEHAPPAQVRWGVTVLPVLMSAFGCDGLEDPRRRT